MSQHLDALALANETRMARAALKRSLVAGTIAVRQVLVDPPESMLTVTCATMLSWLPGIGPAGLDEIEQEALRAFVNIHERLGRMTVRQRLWVLMRLGQVHTRRGHWRVA